MKTKAARTPPSVLRMLASLVLTGALLAVPASAFSDVEAGQYYSEAVAWAVQQGITAGTSPATFSPGATCTRGQILTFLWRAADAPEAGEDLENPFTDVAESAHYYRPVLWALEQGIVEPADTLSPGAPCTRGETMLYLWRYAGSPEVEPAAFSDVPAEAPYAPAVDWAVAAGVTEGTSSATFSPEGICTRGQIVTFLHRALAEPEAPPQEEDGRPLRTLEGQGNAYSLGLNGSEFIPSTPYKASVRAEIFSDREAAFTIRVPFPLYQAGCYSARFVEEESGISFVFSYLRWDEAFEGVVDWSGERYVYRLAELTSDPQSFLLEPVSNDDDRMGGVVTWRVVVPKESSFRFSMAGDYLFDCEVNATPG